MKLFVRRIWSIKDVMFIYNGIRYGIKEKVFTEKDLWGKLKLIIDSNIRFYIFGVETGTDGLVVEVGFGAIKDKKQVYKIFVYPQFRGNGYGIRISSWIMKHILKGGYIPVCWVKDSNCWWMSMKEQGMECVENSKWTTVSKYMLLNLKQYLKMIDKYEIDKIVLVKRQV